MKLLLRYLKSNFVIVICKLYYVTSYCLTLIIAILKSQITTNSEFVNNISFTNQIIEYIIILTTAI